MSASLVNQIDATSKNLTELLGNQKFYIDYFQREYRWQESHIKLLVEDLTNTFLRNYKEGHERQMVTTYPNYFLGPVIFSSDENKKSIIDGQQRITSITLLLIYLEHLQEGKDNIVDIKNLIFSEKHGIKSFNMTEESREPCLKALFREGEYAVKDNDSETVKNMVERYEDIENSFPEELSGKVLPNFIDWLIYEVKIVEIIAHSDENAYTIFETMNDRGLNLTSSEMLKGYVLSRITNENERMEIENIWKIQMQKLHECEKTADQAFFQAWFRGKYAASFRSSDDKENKDFELIGSKFHSWFKDNHEKLFNLKRSSDFYRYFCEEFPFFVDVYLTIWNAKKGYEADMPHIYYIKHWGIADSLQDSLLFASITSSTDKENVSKKLDYMARYIETYTVRRAANFKKFGQSTIKYSMFNLVKKVRNNNVNTLATNLSDAINDMEQKWDAVVDFGWHGRNRRFVKHLLSRVTGYIDALVGKNSTYADYQTPKGTPFEIEHIWGNQFDRHKDEFDHEHDFEEFRNRIGGLILLPKDINQSLSNIRYEEKVEQYLKQNLYAQTLHPTCYVRNPNFLHSPEIKTLNFRSHQNFKKTDLKERSELVKRICEQLWSTDYFKNV